MHLGGQAAQVGLGCVQRMFSAVHAHGNEDGRRCHGGWPKVQVTLLCSHTSTASQSTLAWAPTLARSAQMMQMQDHILTAVAGKVSSHKREEVLHLHEH